MSCCGPGYRSAEDAMNGPREKVLYIPCPVVEGEKADVIATVDVDPESKTYSQVIHTLTLPNVGDELHHTGWNACSSCHDDPSKERRYLVCPGIKSSRIYFIDTKDPNGLSVYKTIEPEELAKVDLSAPHSSHCLGSGDIMISFMGDKEGKAKGTLLLVDSDFKIKEYWNKSDSKYGYDFWY